MNNIHASNSMEQSPSKEANSHSASDEIQACVTLVLWNGDNYNS
jgi:hypothetical protein